MPRPSRSRSSRTTATTPPNRWASTASTSEITTGLPNIGITNFTGLSGGPAFLPVNPSQFHYQIEDGLVWLKGRHQLKFGYRLVDRRPSPWIHDNTRSAINSGTSFVNNPLTNAGGTGLAAVLLGYSTTRAGDSCSRSTSGSSSRARSCRTTSRSTAGSPSTRACATRSSIRRPRRTTGWPTSTTSVSSWSTPERTAPAAAPTRRRTTSTSRRAWA